jgi:hypothetical protein
VQATERKVSQRFQPPNTDGKSMANTASGPPITTAGMTPNTGPCVTLPRKGRRSAFDGASLVFFSSDLASLSFFSGSTSGPRPGFSLGSVSGSAFLSLR